MRAILTAALCLTALPSAVYAETCGVDIQARFIESAPRDRFVIENRSSIPTAIASLALDLRGSAGRLIFDTEDGGDGVQVFQPYRTEDGDAVLSAAPVVNDGDDRLSLSFDSFGSGQTYRFSIDVDDRLTNSDRGQTMISGGEMQGATVVAMTAEGSVYQASFDAANRAQLTAPCS